MSEESYLESRRQALAEEFEWRKIANDIRDKSWELVRDFGYFNSQYDSEPLELPWAFWSDDHEHDLFSLLPLGEEEYSLHKAELEDVPPELQWEHVTSFSVVYLPDETAILGSDLITVATISQHSGYDKTPIIIDPSGESLTKEELEGLRNDISRYRALVESGRTEQHRPAQRP